MWEVGSDTVTCVRFPGRFISKIFWEPEDSLYTAIELKVIPPDLQEIEDSYEDLPQSASSGSVPNTAPITTNPTLLERAKRIMEAREAKNRRKDPTTVDKNKITLDQSKPIVEVKTSNSNTTPTTWKKPTRVPVRKKNTGGPSGDKASETKISTTSSMLEKGKGTTTSKVETKRREIKQTRGPYLSTAKIPEGPAATSSQPLPTPRPGTMKPSGSLESNSLVENFKRNRLRKEPIPPNTKRGTKSEKEASIPPIRSNTTTRRFRDRRFQQKAIEETSEVSVGRVDTDLTDEEEPRNQIRTLFICSQKGILTHEKIWLDEGIETLLGLDVPYWYFLSRSTSNDRKAILSVSRIHSQLIF